MSKKRIILTDAEREEKNRYYREWYKTRKDAIALTRQSYYQRNRLRLLTYQNAYNFRVRKGGKHISELIESQTNTFHKISRRHWRSSNKHTND